MNDQPEEAEDDHIQEGRTLLSQSAPTPVGHSPKARSGTAISSSGDHKKDKRSNGVWNRDSKNKKKKSSDEAKTNTKPPDGAEAALVESAANDEHKVVGEQPAASVLKAEKHGNGPGGELEESVELHSPLPRRLQDQNDVVRKSGSFKRSNNKDDNNNSSSSSSSSSNSSSPDLPHKEDDKHKKKKEEKERRKERRESKADVCDHPRRASSELLRGGKGRTFWNRERTPRRGILVRSMSAEQLLHNQRASFDGAEFKRKKHKKHKRKAMQDEGVKFDKVVVRHYPREICLGGCMLNPDQGPFLGIGWDWKQEEVHNLYSFERLREPLRHVAHAIPSGLRHELLLHYGLNEGEIQELVLEMKRKDKELQRGNSSSSFLPSFWPWKKAG